MRAAIARFVRRETTVFVVAHPWGPMTASVWLVTASVSMITVVRSVDAPRTRGRRDRFNPAWTAVPSTVTVSNTESTESTPSLVATLGESAHQHRANVLVGREDLERVADLFLICAAVDVEEIRRLAPRELDDVHGGHCQAGAVHHATDGAVQTDVI